MADGNQDFEFSGMFDNIDNMEVNLKDQNYQKILNDSRTIQAVKDITQKLQQLRSDFQQDENKLQTVRDATGKLKDKVKEKAGKIINKNLEKQKQKF